MWRHPARQKTRPRRLLLRLTVFTVLLLLGVAGYFGYKIYDTSPAALEQKITQRLAFDESLTIDEQQKIKNALVENDISLNNDATARAATKLTSADSSALLAVYVPVSSFNSVRQKITSTELATVSIYVPEGMDDAISQSIAKQFGNSIENVLPISDLTTLPDESIAFVPTTDLSPLIKLLYLDDIFYLDTFDSGAIFRSVEFDGDGAEAFNGLSLGSPLAEEDVYTVNMTGVTALTRIMMRKLAAVGDPLYFSEKIGDFLSDADITHVSNEVSFKAGCTYSNTLFCSPPEFIETLKASGVDLVEITGNHNNDLGSDLNTETINLYTSLGWGVYGGGLNKADAAKPHETDVKGSKVTFLGYNYPDSPSGGAIAGANRAGANDFDFARIEADIAAAAQSGAYVLVSVQFWECYAYPDGYIEYPECDKPIGEQESVFKKIIDLGADMVVGSSAHQPQTYELYNGKPIYYGLGNLYFDQTSWPGTERGIILTHYFHKGNLLQTKLTGNVYDEALQPRVMTDDEMAYLLGRLQAAR